MVKPLLLRSSLRYMSQHLGQTCLTVLGIVLGVAIVVAVDLANSSAKKAFALSLQTISGNTSHQLRGGPDGVPENIYVEFRRVLGIQSSAPMISDYVSVQDNTYTLLGIDPIAEIVLARHQYNEGNGLSVVNMARFLLEQNTVIMSARTAKKLKITVDEDFVLQHRSREYRVKVVNIFSSDNPAATENLLFADISTAQEILGRLGKLDSIDLSLDEKQLNKVKNWLPETLTLVSSENRQDSMQQMTTNFHINLTAMSLLALLVGALLVHNSMTFSVLQRRQVLGSYRTLGVTRQEIFRLVLMEVFVLGSLGTLLGLVFGIALAQGLVQLVMRTVNDLFFVLHVSEFFISGVSIAKGFCVGIGVCLLAAILPAMEAANSQPVNVLQRSVVENRWRRQLPILSVMGLVLMIIGWFLLGQNAESLVFSFVALAFIVFGFCLLVPLCVFCFVSILAMILWPLLGGVGRMALRGINASMSRIGLAIAALTVAISVTIGVGVMVSSFRYTVDLWLEQLLQGDVYVSLAGRMSSSSSDGLSSALIEDLHRLEGVAAVSQNRRVRVETEFGQLRLFALDSNEEKSRGFHFIDEVENIREIFVNGKGILISEPLAYHQHLGVGDDIQIDTDIGPKILPVIGIFYDYTSSQGLIAMHRTLYESLWRDRKVFSLTLYKDNTVSQSELLENVSARISQESSQLLLRSSGEIRANSMQIFDRTFAITNVLRLLAILVAFVGVLSALMAVQLERLKELAILRATGMTPAQVSALVIGQTALMGLIAGSLSIPLGLMMSKILIDVVNLRSFGWSMQHVLPFEVLLEAIILALVAAVMAGLYPAFKAARIFPSQALREE